MAKSSIVVAAAMLFAGCATTPSPVVDAPEAPIERLLAFQARSPDKGSLVVVRDAGFLGRRCFYAVSINGVLAGRLAEGEKATFFVEPGEILLRSGRDPQGTGLCSFMKDEWTQRETIVRPNESKHFRLSIDGNGKTDIQRTDP